MTNTAFKSVNRRVTAFRAEVDQWKIDYDRAMQCLDFELLLQVGLVLYQQVNSVDEAWRAHSLSSDGDHDQEIEASLLKLYRWWLEPCDVLLVVLGEFQKDGFVVQYGDDFVSACNEVRGVLTNDAEFFCHDALADKRDQAIDAFRRGETESMET